MDDVLDELLRITQRCERAAEGFDAEPLAAMVTRMQAAIDDVGKAWSGSPLGYHAHVYLEEFRPKLPGDFFDCDLGLSHGFGGQTSGAWREYAYQAVLDEILKRAKAPNYGEIPVVAESAEEVFSHCRRDILPTLDALLALHEDARIKSIRDEIAELKSHFSEKDLVQAQFAGRRLETRDMRAYKGGVLAPPHLKAEAWLLSQLSYGRSAKELAEKARYLVTYLQKRHKMTGKSVARTDGKIFIGHGRSAVWRDLKDFLHERLGLQWDEFNRESTAGVATTERLSSMLDEAVFGFLVMTAEDEHADETKHARENVVHEVGLFQGRLGFKRAIVLLEEGCTEFSNISGLGQIRFPKGNISAKFDEIRRVLEREGIIR